MKIAIPEFALVVLIGSSGSGKSTFARQHFKPTEVLSSDACRGLVSDDENDQSVTKTAFEVLHIREDQAPSLTAQQSHDDLLDVEDVMGKRIIVTRLRQNITIREENAIAALETMSRFAVNPKWLIYLPPTMSPCETSKRDGLLEHPEDAFAHYLHEGAHKVVCQQKHMGSRAVVVVCRDADAAHRRFGIVEGEAGVCCTRTGRRFFNDTPLESEFLEKVRRAVEVAGIWKELKT